MSCPVQSDGNYSWFVCTKNSGQNILGNGGKRLDRCLVDCFRLRYVCKLQINLIIRLLRVCAN